MPISPAEAELWARAEKARAALLAVAREVRPAGVRLLVIKGAYIAFALSDAPWRRWMDDADAIVVSGSFGRAVGLLRRSPEFESRGVGWSTATFLHRPTQAAVDLHRMALPPGFGRVSLRDLRARARHLPAFGEHVLCPDPLDAACISIANYVKDRLGDAGHGRLAFDLDAFIERASVAPAPLANRLHELGLRRVGLVGFAALAREDPKWRTWAVACSHSRLELDAARRTVAVIESLCRSGHEDVAFMLVRSIADRIVPGSAIGFALTAARLTRDRVLAMVR